MPLARHAILAQTSSISDPDRIFATQLMEVGSADKLDLAFNWSNDCFRERRIS